MKLIRFVSLVGMTAIFSVSMRCPAGSVNVGAGYTLLANPASGGLIDTVLPSATESDEVIQWDPIQNQYVVDVYAATVDDVGFIGWYDAVTTDPGTINWASGYSVWYFCTSSAGETLNFAGDPPQPVPTVQVGYNFLGNITGNVLGYDDIALGQLDPAVCPAYLYNRTTGNLDAYISGVGTPLSVNPDEGVIFLKPPVLSISPSPTNSSQLMVTWQGGGQLQATTNLNSGPWTNISNATSPFPVTNYPASSLFLRVSMPPPSVPGL